VITDAVLDFIQGLAEAVLRLAPGGLRFAVPDLSGWLTDTSGSWGWFAYWLPFDVVATVGSVIVATYLVVSIWTFLVYLAEKLRLFG